MKQGIDRWRKFKERALSRDRRPLSRGPRDNRSRVNGQELLLFALCNFLERSGLLERASTLPEAELLVMAIHDWKESIKDGN